MPQIVLTPAERKVHRAAAHHLDPVVMIGADGLTDAVLHEANAALNACCVQPLQGQQLDGVTMLNKTVGQTQLQNRLDHSINSLATTTENLTAAESRIRDVDMAKEMMNFTKFNILNQAATAMLAQANQLPQTVLQLLK